MGYAAILEVWDMLGLQPTLCSLSKKIVPRVSQHAMSNLPVVEVKTLQLQSHHLHRAEACFASCNARQMQKCHVACRHHG